MPSYDNLIQVARSVKRDLDHDSKAFRSYERMELTNRLRAVSGEPTTRIKLALGADLERALSDQGLRCYPRLTETTTGDRIRIFRAGSTVGDLLDAVLVPSPDHDRRLAEALEKFKGASVWDLSSHAGASEATAAELFGKVLPRGEQLEYVRSLDDPDLATT